MNKLVLWTEKNDREYFYQSIDFDGDCKNYEEVVSAINDHLKKRYKPVWGGDVLEIGDTLLVLLYESGGERRYNYGCCIATVTYVDSQKVGECRKPTRYEHELSTYIALHNADGTFDKKVGTEPPQ